MGSRSELRTKSPICILEYPHVLSFPQVDILISLVSDSFDPNIFINWDQLRLISRVIRLIQQHFLKGDQALSNHYPNILIPTSQHYPSHSFVYQPLSTIIQPLYNHYSTIIQPLSQTLLSITRWWSWTSGASPSRPSRATCAMKTMPSSCRRTWRVCCTGWWTFGMFGRDRA